MNRNIPAPGFEKYPAHEITIKRETKKWRVMVADHLIARSNNVVALAEGGYPPRLYFPRSDVNFTYLKQAESRTYCPFKGAARYWDVIIDGRIIVEDAVWAYDDPFRECIDIKTHLCFYGNKDPLKVLAGN